MLNARYGLLSLIYLMTCHLELNTKHISAKKNRKGEEDLDNERQNDELELRGLSLSCCWWQFGLEVQ